MFGRFPVSNHQDRISYDFDFASLNFTLRHLIDPGRPFRVGVTDFVRSEAGPRVVDKGWIEFVPRGEVKRHGFSCRAYAVDGPGLEDRGGVIWVRKQDGVIVDYEIDLPDEPGFSDGKLQLISEEKISAEAWDAFKRDKLRAE